MKTPKNIIEIINSNRTSLGDNPSLPPELDDKFLVFLVEEYYGSLLNHFDSVNADELSEELSDAVTECKNIEANNKGTLEKLCVNIVNELFQIPSDTISIDVKLVDSVDTKQERLVPEKSSDFSFESISDMNGITSEIYKRRFLNALITGVAMYYGENVNGYAEELRKIDSRLIPLYKEITTTNNLLLFHTKENVSGKHKDGGRVDVYISSEELPVMIKSQGVLFPMLLEETIKGLLELAISHGLPSDRKKAEYIIGKTDFKLAEIWDQRLGIPLWKRIVKLMKKGGESPSEVGLNFLFMELSKLKPSHFNPVMQEILAGTNAGKKMVKDLSAKIQYQKEQDEFDDYITNKQQDTDYQLNDEEFTSDELISDDLCASAVLDETEF